MTKLKLVNAKEMEKVLFNIGFIKTRQKGSHAFYKHPDGRYTTLPHHKGRVISRPLLRAILREINMSLEDFEIVVK